MGFGAYIRAHWGSMTARAVCAVLLCGLLVLMGLTVAEAGLALVVLVVVDLCLLLMDWLRERTFMEEVEGVAASRRDALALASGLKEPSYGEGRIAWQAMQSMVRESNARVGELKVREADYRDYVETWVHEIKTPLAAADLMLENMEGVNTHPLRQELDQVNAYVEQALYYARSTAVERDFVVRACDVGDLVRDALKSRASQLIGLGVAPDLSGLDGTAPQVLCDPKWVRFILGQFVDNAMHYRSRERQPRISFGTRALAPGTADERVLLDVRDNGVGIPATDIGRVFDKGFTGENGRAHKKSTGIGLYLVRTLCDKMGVGIVATSLPGEWTCFTLSLPVAESLGPEEGEGPRG